MRLHDGFARGGIHQLVHQAQARHGVLGVANSLAVTRRDFLLREFFRQRGAADEQGNFDARVFQIVGGDHHLLGAFHQQTGQADGVRLVLAVGFDQIFRRNLDAEIDDVIAVIFQNDFDQILADVVHVAFDGGENDLAALGGVGLLHELLEVTDGGFHGFRRLQHLGDDQFVVVEEAADFGHAGHQRAVDDIERRGAFGALAVEVGDQAVAGAFDDVVGEALVEREIGGADFLFFSGGAEMLGDGRNVKLVDGGALFFCSVRASQRERC